MEDNAEKEQYDHEYKEPEEPGENDIYKEPEEQYMSKDQPQEEDQADREAKAQELEAAKQAQSEEPQKEDPKEEEVKDEVKEEAKEEPKQEEPAKAKEYENAESGLKNEDQPKKEYKGEFHEALFDDLDEEMKEHEAKEEKAAEEKAEASQQKEEAEQPEAANPVDSEPVPQAVRSRRSPTLSSRTSRWWKTGRSQVHSTQPRRPAGKRRPQARSVLSTGGRGKCRGAEEGAGGRARR